ncbi:MAG: hypothetical protein R3F41_07385 [Gammaproteobacteria bacterium]|nr:hypothetical protein [Pseudomonadales bacterium]MCP5348743.1 hypothetical protein [Pseudomonadales bacterium]
MAIILCVPLHGAARQASAPDPRQEISGYWVINDELSDNTDDQVEEAIRAAGGKVQRRSWFSKREEDRYRGGPADQELYDRVSYDDVLTIQYDAPEFVFEYADNYRRVFHTDGRKRSTGASDYYESGGEDFSFGNWNGSELIVEGRPRDGGYTLESYTLEQQGQRLRVVMTLEPFVFGGPIHLTRVYDRASPP